MLAPLGLHMIDRHNINLEAKNANKALSVSRPATIKGLPVRIVVPDAAIDLEIVKGYYSNTSKTWSVSPTLANYATNTAEVNNQHSQTLIYGHNNRKVFGSLLKLSPGAEVLVYTDNGHIFKYKLRAADNISPDTDIFKQMAAAGPGLKLITCDGAYFQYRHLMSLDLAQST